MHVKISKEDVVVAQADDRGRVYLGTQYADETVELAVLDVEELSTEGE